MLYFVGFEIIQINQKQVHFAGFLTDKILISFAELTEWEKKVLVWTKRYPSVKDIPEHVS